MMTSEEFRVAQKIAVDAVRTGGPLSPEPFADEITEFYLQQSRKNGGGSYATAYALMRVLELLRGDDEADCGIVTAVRSIADVLEEFKDLKSVSN